MQDLPRTLKHLTVWLLLAVLVFLGAQAWQAQRQRPAWSLAGGVLTLNRGADGHFHWVGRLQGPTGQTRATFLVDTGATRTALPRQLADMLGLKEGRAVQSSTAGGVAQGWISAVDLELEGGVRIERLAVTVLPDLDAPLLGMDVLGRLPLTQRDGRLQIDLGQATPSR